MLGKEEPLVVLEYPGGKGGGMNTEQYISQVLDGHLKIFYDQVELERPGVVFQQDGALSHTEQNSGSQTLSYFFTQQILQT